MAAERMAGRTGRSHLCGQHANEQYRLNGASTPTMPDGIALPAFGVVSISVVQKLANAGNSPP